MLRLYTEFHCPTMRGTDIQICEYTDLNITLAYTKAEIVNFEASKGSVIEEHNLGKFEIKSMTKGHIYAYILLHGSQISYQKQSKTVIF